jgi:membrane-associated protease RseP (regulator of RpoE activity)
MQTLFELISANFQLSAAIFFFLFLGIFLFYKRKRLDIQKMVFPLLYAILYKTKMGLKAMDGAAKKFPKTLKWISFAGVYTGFAGMAFIFISLVYNLYKIIFADVKVGAAIVQPFVPTQPGSMFFYVPFFYFIIAIFIIAVVHEFSHGVVSRLFGIKLKSSGFAFLAVLIPIIPMAFVEPDEKMVKKAKPMQQLAIFAAGPFSNILLAVLIILLLNFAIAPMMGGITTTNLVVTNYTYNGNITYPAQEAGIGLGDHLVMIDNTEIIGTDEFVDFMKGTVPGQEIVLHTNASSYPIILASSPVNNQTGYLGIYVIEKYNYADSFRMSYAWTIPLIEWINGLFIWLIILNLGIGLINLAPLGPVDGGRMLLTVLRTRFKEERAMLIWGKISLITLAILLLNVFLPSIMKVFGI